MDANQTVANGAVQAPHITNIPKETDLNSPIPKDPETVENEINEPKNEVSDNFTIIIYKKFQISICKPLLPLKITLFLWYGGGVAFATFLTVFLKQRGITLGELSTAYAISPVFQILSPTLSGIIADKTGRSKPVLVVNLLLVVGTILGLLLAPSLKVNCPPQPVDLDCHPQELGGLIEKTNCDVTINSFELFFCNATCPENITRYCNRENLICELLEENGNFDNFSVSAHVNSTYKFESKCHYMVTSISHKNITYPWCNVQHKVHCKLSCLTNSDDDCPSDSSYRTKILILYLALIVLFFAAFANCFRITDVTSMCLAKDHNSDFGRERFFATAGVLVCSPLVGYIVDNTTVEGSEKNYSVAFYFFIGVIALLLIVIYKLEVRIKSPGKNMWSKSLYLLKNPDVITFILALIVLGTAWGFTKQLNAWYLEGLKAPGFLLGLLNASNALYGLPFLFTSNWWVKKIGATRILILGFLGYVASGIGYSLLYEPKLALLIEATSIVTYHLLWVAVIVHGHSIAPDGLTATVISTSGAIHYSLGKCSGGLFGGLLMSAFGGRVAYRVMSVICLGCAVLYAVFLYTRKMCFPQSHNLERRNEPGSICYDNDGFTKGTKEIKSRL